MLPLRHRRIIAAAAIAGLTSVGYTLPASAASLASMAPGGAALWERAPAVIQVDADDAAFRRWLRQRRAQDLRAQRVLDGTATAEETRAVGEQFKSERQAEYRLWLRRKARDGSVRAQTVLSYFNNEVEYSDDIAYWRGQLVGEFREERFRERDFVVWIGIQAATPGAAYQADASIVLANEDGFLDNVDQDEQDRIKAIRSQMLRRYTQRLNQQYGEHEVLTEGLADALAKRILLRNQQNSVVRLSNANIRLPIDVQVDENETLISNLVGAIEERTAEIEQEFGSFSANPLYRTLTVADEQGRRLRPQARFDPLCGIASNCMFDDTPLDEVLLSDNPPNDYDNGSFPEDWVAHLRRRGFAAATMDVAMVGNNPRDEQNRTLKINAIRNALKHTNYPVIASIRNNNQLSRFYRNGNQVDVDDATDSLDPALAARLRTIKNRNSYFHAIVVDDLYEVLNLQQAQIRDPNAEFYSVAGDALARTMELDITYVTGLLPAAAADNQSNGSAVSLDPPDRDNASTGN